MIDIIKLRKISNHEIVILKDNNNYIVRDYNLINGIVCSDLQYSTLKQATKRLYNICYSYRDIDNMFMYSRR